MKRLLCIFFALFALLIVPVHALESGVEVTDVYTDDDGVNHATITTSDYRDSLLSSSSSSTSETVAEEPLGEDPLEEESFEEDFYYDYENDFLSSPARSPAAVPQGVLSLSSSDEGTMKAVIESLFGIYEPVQQEITVYLDDGTAIDGTEVVNGMAGVDWAYVLGVLGFFIVLYSAFRLLGVFFK